jgi:mycothiol system anti-sigma-R factor
MTERNCNETLRELETFLDGELSAAELVIIRSHIEDCPQCLEAFDFHAELRAVIARKCASDPMPAGLLARIEECFQTDLDGDGRIG